MSKSDYLENKVLDHCTGKTSFTKPTAYVALFDGDPTDAGSGGVEVSGGSYGRVATAGADWNAASGGVVTNATDLDFPTPTADWGDVTHFATMDASTAGHFLYIGALDNAKTIGTGDPVKFPAGELELTED